MEAVPVRPGKRGVAEYADDWFIDLREEDYRTDVGLIDPDEPSPLIV